MIRLFRWLFPLPPHDPDLDDFHFEFRRPTSSPGYEAAEEEEDFYEALREHKAKKAAQQMAEKGSPYR